MKRSWFLPTFLLGSLVGWFVRSLIYQPALHLDAVFTGGMTFAVGWWIQRTLRRQTELDKVPIEAVAKLTARLDDLIVQCLDAGSAGDPYAPALLLALKLLANEITWLGTFMDSVGTERELQARLFEQFRALKIRLTGGPTVILFEAAEIARTMRADCLRIRWALCEHVLDSPDDFASVREPSPPSGSAKREDDSARITIQGV